MTPTDLRELIDAGLVAVGALRETARLRAGDNPTALDAVADRLVLACHKAEGAASLLTSLETQQAALRTVIAQWREIAAGLRQETAGGFLGVGLAREREVCADQLEAALGTLSPSPSEARGTTAGATLPWEAIGHTGVAFDPSNHHNALACPYCNPDRLTLAAQSPVESIAAINDHRIAEDRGTDATEAAIKDIVEEMHRWVVGAIAGTHDYEMPTIPARKIGEWVTRFDDALRIGPRYAEPTPPPGGETPR